MISRRGFLSSCAAIFAAPLIVDAQETGKVARIGIVSLASPRTAPWWVAFDRRLQELGYAEGKTLAVNFLNAEGHAERLVELVAELVRRKVDVIVAPGPEVTLRAASQATRSVPIVTVAVDYDPTARGYVASLGRPGGNITGIFANQLEFTAKRLDLLKQDLPKVTRVAVLWDAISADQLKPRRPPHHRWVCVSSPDGFDFLGASCGLEATIEPTRRTPRDRRVALSTSGLDLRERAMPIGSSIVRLRTRLSTIRIQLFILVLLGVLPALGLILYSATVQRKHAIAEVQDTALRLARLASSEHGQHLAGTESLLVALARLPEVRRQDAERCNALLGLLLEGYQSYANFGVIAPSGQVICRAMPVPPSTNLADRSYFQRAVQTRRFAIGDYQIGRITGRATVNVAYPIFNERQQTVDAVVFAAIDLAALNEILRRANMPSESSLTVTDGRGTILVRYPDGDRWVGKAMPDSPDIAAVLASRVGVAETIALDGVPTLLGFSPLLNRPEAGDVYVSIGIPTQSAVASANRKLGLSLLALLLVAAAGFAAASIMSKTFVVRPVESLLNGSRRVAAGHLCTRLPEQGGGELQELTRAFNEMTAALERDRTEREETQRQLHAQRDSLYRCEKLAAIGRLAAGVAHELSNPLSVIGGRIELLRLALAAGPMPDAPTLSNHVTQLQEASTRMHSIMEGLSTSSKPSKPEPQVLDLDQLLAGIRELVAYEARRANVAVRLELEEAGLTARGDRSHLIQILLNLATNAVQAMAMGEGGGELVLRARHGMEKNEVVVDVADTGPGIAADRLERIWDAFYTTKAEGTGLGLAIVRSLVEENGGHISVVSEVGKGTVFTVVFSTPTD